MNRKAQDHKLRITTGVRNYNLVDEFDNPICTLRINHDFDPDGNRKMNTDIFLIRNQEIDSDCQIRVVDP